MDVNEVVATYGSAWNEPDASKRRSLLDTSWAEEGVYQDPLGRAEGRAALVAHIGEFQQNMPGLTIEASSGVDTYGRVFRFSWVVKDANGNVALEGMDFGEIAADGRVASITGFFGSFPATG
jgi:hypothetical protein